MSVSPDYKHGIIDALTIAANCAQTMIDRHELSEDALFLISCLRDGYASAALIAGLEEPDADSAG